MSAFSVSRRSVPAGAIPVWALALVLLPLLIATQPAAARDRLGAVVRVQGTVSAGFEGETRPLQAGALLYREDTLLTGAEARVEAELDDGSRLTLGADGALTLDDLVAPRDSRPVAQAFAVLAGAFRLVAAPTPGAVIRTPVATLGVRGTDFWGGPIDGAYGVLLLEGAVEVRNAGGATLLDRPGLGTSVADPGTAPGQPTAWPQDKVNRAVATVTFR